MTETLIIFSRYPQPGQTKTRLISALGALGAAQLQKEMTEHTLRQAIALTSSQQIAIEVHFAGGDRRSMRAWLGKDLVYIPQGSGDLGEKMQSAFDRAFALGNQRVVIIGTDCPDLDCQILTKAFNVLHDHELVLGVAEDGGYYLIGLNHPVPELFQNIPWGTAQVLNETKKIAQELQLKVNYLPTLADVDRPEDLKLWRKYQ